MDEKQIATLQASLADAKKVAAEAGGTDEGLNAEVEKA